MSQAQPVPSSHGPALGGGRPTLLPAGMADFLRRRALEVLGLGLIVLALLLALALVSYDGADPSWNNASSAQARNWLGLRHDDLLRLRSKAPGRCGVALGR